MTDIYDIRNGQGIVLRTTLTLDTTALSSALERTKQALRDQLAPTLRTMAQSFARALDPLGYRANDPVHVAGLEARYYTRAALAPAYATPESLRGLVRAVLDPDSEEAEGLWLMSPANRRLVAVSAMTGWAEHRAGSGAGQVCAHRQWGTTRVEVRCG